MSGATPAPAKATRNNAATRRERPAGASVRLTVELPAATLAVYEGRAADRGTSLEAEVAQTLTRCQAHTAAQPLYFDDTDRRRLADLTGGHIENTPAQVIERIAATRTINVGGVSIELGEQLLNRLRTRCFRGDTMDSLITRVVTQALEAHCGMR